MRTSLLAGTAAMLVTLVAGVDARQAQETQNVTLSEKLQIPGAVLKPGQYTFSIEDRLQDRAIVRITSADSDKHFLLLTVPNAQLHGSDGSLVFFTADANKHVLRGWSCPGCSSTLEVVYPKAEAAKLTETTTEPVMAVDPAYDKLPENLSPDDMKVVTLWLLSPKPLTARDRTPGVQATKYVPATNTASTPSAQVSEPQSAQVSAPAVPSTPAPDVSATPAPAMPAAGASARSTPVEMASSPAASSTQATPAGQRRSRLPKTATNNFSFILCGLALMLAAGGLRASRRRRAS